MFFSFVALAALIGSVSAGPLKARDYTPPPLAQFQLITSAAGPNEVYDGLYPLPFHTGAGTNAAVLTSAVGESPDWLFNSTTGDVYFQQSQGSGQPTVPYSIGFSNSAPYNSTAPAGYNVVTINAGYANAGISFSGANLTVPAQYGTLAACSVNGVAPYFSLGPQVQLLWRADGVAQGANCSDVILRAIPVAT